MIAEQMGNTSYRGRILWMLLTARPDLLPIDLKRALFEKLSAEIARQIENRGATEEEILSDFESWRKTRRETRRRR